MSADLAWKKSSFSTNNGECVELARTEDRLAVRDSKNPAGPVLSLPHRALREVTSILAH